MASTTSNRGGENRPLVILGASGRLGTLLHLSWPMGDEVVRHSTRAAGDFVVFDLILDSEMARECMAGARAVICLSGVTDARAKSRGDVYSRNSELALAALHAAHDAGAGRVFAASSAAVYGAAAGVHQEQGPCAPLSAYGRAKLAMENDLLTEGARLGHPVTALRIGNVAGADAILGGWRAGMQIDRFPDGRTPRRSFIGPQTLARVLHALSLAPDLPPALNIAAPGAIEMGALLDAAGLAWTPREAPPEAIAEVTLSTELLARHVPLPPDCGSAQAVAGEWREVCTVRAS